MTVTGPYEPQIVVKHKKTRKPIPYVGFKYPNYQSLDAFPVLGAIDFGVRNHRLKKQYKTIDSPRDITKKVAFYTAHAAVLAGTVAMAIEPVREQIFYLVEKLGNYFM